MSIVTKTGDTGETSLLGGERVRKTDVRIVSYGVVDELNASIGVALAYVEQEAVTKTLHQVQNDLFRIGAELAALTSEEKDIDVPRISSKHLSLLESEVERVEGILPPQKAFILPKGNASAAHLHLARTICRRAERSVIRCAQKHPVNQEVIRYLNRLGDLLFIYARKENKETEEAVSYE